MFILKNLATTALHNLGLKKINHLKYLIRPNK